MRIVALRLRSESLWLLALAVGVSGASASDAPSGAAVDLEARIQYAYFTEDRRTLDDIARAVAEAEAPPLDWYLIAFADYRRAQLAAEKQPGMAKNAADRCAERAGVAQEKDAKLVEASALRAACANVVAAVTRVTAPLAGSSGAASLRRALRAAPRSPRVRLVELAADFDRLANDKAARGRLVDRCREVVELFEAERRGPVRVPSWGGADAYVYLGRALLDSDDTLGAREAFEQALLLAPEFELARRWAARITSRG